MRIDLLGRVKKHLSQYEFPDPKNFISQLDSFTDDDIERIRRAIDKHHRKDVFLEIFATKEDAAFDELITAFIDNRCAIATTLALDEEWEEPIGTRSWKDLAERLKGYLKADPWLTTMQPIPGHATDHIRDWVTCHLDMVSGQRKLMGVHEYPDIFKKALLLGQPQLLVFGEPGMGKSCLVKRICFDWAMGNAFTDYDLVLPAFLADIQPSTDRAVFQIPFEWLKLYFHRFPKLAQLLDNVFLELSELDEMKWPKVLVLLDGWDENQDVCSELGSFRPMRFPFHSILTSRPLLKDVPSKTSVISILGFNDDQKKKFMSKFGMEAEKEKLLWEMLQKETRLKELAKIPLLLAFLCVIGEYEKLSRMTDIYLKIFEWQIESYLNRNKIQREPGKNWLNDPRILHLGQMALLGLLAQGKEQLYFPVQQSWDIEETFGIGFIHRELHRAVGADEKSGKLAFPHKTIQEFFAALFLLHGLQKKMSWKHYFLSFLFSRFKFPTTLYDSLAASAETVSLDIILPPKDWSVVHVHTTKEQLIYLIGHDETRLRLEMVFVFLIGLCSKEHQESLLSFLDFNMALMRANEELPIIQLCFRK